MQHDLEVVKTQISTAFKNRSYPGDDYISYDQTGYCLECLAVSNYFRGKTWEAISWADLSENYPGDPSACLGFMTTEAFSYYFPAYLLIATEHYDDSDTIPSVMIFKLQFPTDELDRAKFLEWVSSLSDSEKRSVRSFLYFMQSHHSDDFLNDEPGQAIKQFWDKF